MGWTNVYCKSMLPMRQYACDCFQIYNTKLVEAMLKTDKTFLMVHVFPCKVIPHLAPTRYLEIYDHWD